MESIVACLIAVIVGGITFTVFQMADQLVGNGGISTKINMHYGIVIMQIGKSIRGSNAVMEIQTWPPAANGTPTTTSVIYLYSITGTQTGGYKVNGTTLQEFLAGSWQNFMIGSSAVQVTASSNFSLSGDRETVTLGLNVFSTYRSLKDTVTSKQESYKCRN